MDSSKYIHMAGGYELDRNQDPCRIGLLVLDNDHVIERDMMSMRPRTGVNLYTARVPFDERCTPETLASMKDHLAEAAASMLRGGRIDSVVFGCTSGTAVIGYDSVARSIRASHPNAAVVTPVTAAHAAFELLGISTIAVLTPYTKEVTATTVAALEEGGVDAVKVTYMGIEASADINAVAPRSVLEAAIEADEPKADCLFVSCTDFRAAQVIGEIELRIGKPVISSNQASFWQAARKGGYAKPISGFGRLLMVPE